MTLNVGLVGYGYASHTFHAPLIRSTPGLVLRAVSSRDAARVRAACGEAVDTEASPEALLARGDLDLVVIPTPNDSHAPLARAALQTGCHVVVDKPFTLNAAEAAGLVALAAERGRVLSVFHNRRWDNDFLAVREVLASGVLGRLVQVQCHFDRFRPTVLPRWRDGGGPGSGLWLDLGSHLLDQALQLFGPPRTIWADLAAQRDGALATDAFHARLHYDSGLRVSLQASTLAALPGPRFALHGTRGSLRIDGLDPQESALKSGALPGAQAWGGDTREAVLALASAEAPNELRTHTRPLPAGNYPAYYAAVRDAVLGLAPNPVPAEEAWQVMRWLDLGVASAAAGRALALADA